MRTWKLWEHSSWGNNIAKQWGEEAPNVRKIYGCTKPIAQEGDLLIVGVRESPKNQTFRMVNVDHPGNPRDYWTADIEPTTEQRDE